MHVSSFEVQEEEKNSWWNMSLWHLFHTVSQCESTTDLILSMWAAVISPHANYHYVEVDPRTL
jgi:hypothetical protein